MPTATHPFGIDPARTYTLGEVATLIKVDRTTVYRWVRLGVLKAHRRGIKSLVITGDDLLAAVKPA